MVFAIGKDKSPRVDGFNQGFYQKYWGIVRDKVTKECLKWLERGYLSAELNNTIIALIPKRTNPATMKELRQIALCNVIYKIVVKVLVNRLKRVLLTMISETQSAFVEG